MPLFVYTCEECGFEGVREEDDYPFMSHEEECEECGALLEGRIIEEEDMDLDD